MTHKSAAETLGPAQVGVRASVCASDNPIGAGAYII